MKAALEQPPFPNECIYNTGRRCQREEELPSEEENQTMGFSRWCVAFSGNTGEHRHQWSPPQLKAASARMGARARGRPPQQRQHCRHCRRHRRSSFPMPPLAPHDTTTARIRRKGLAIFLPSFSFRRRLHHPVYASSSISKRTAYSRRLWFFSSPRFQH